MIEKTYHSAELLDKETERLNKSLSEKVIDPGKMKKDFDLDWVNIPTLEDLKDDLEGSRTFHDDNMAKIARWRALMSPVAKKREKTGDNSRSTLQPKVIRKMAEWRYASLSEPFLSNDELFAVSPRTWEDRDVANKNAILLNYQFKNKFNFTKFINEYIRSLVDEGTAILRPIWVTETRKRMKEVNTFKILDSQNEDFIAAFESALHFHDTSPSQYLTEVPEVLKKSVEVYVETGDVFEFEVSGTEYEEEEYLSKNYPSAEIFPSDNTYLDPSWGSTGDRAKFVIYRFESNIADLTADGRYSNLEFINPDVSSWKNDSSHPTTGTDVSDFNYKDRARKRIEVMEYWGFLDVYGDDSLTPVVITWVGDTIIRMEESPFTDRKLPCIPVTYMPQKDSPYGEPDAELLEDNQAIQGALTRGIVDLLAKNASGQQGMAKGMLDPVNKIRFQRGEDYEFNPNFHPEQHINTHKFSEIPRSAIEMLSITNSEAESLTGVKAFNEGLTQNSLGNVATSVRGVLDAASKRESDILRRAAEGIEELGRRFLAMNADFLEDEEMIRITNERFVKIFRKEIGGEYDLKLSIMTAEETSARSQELTFMIQTIAPSLDPEIVKLLLTEYARLNKLPDVAHAIKNYQPEPDPFMQQMQELQLQEQMLKVEQAKLNLNNTQVDTALKQAKAMSEQAKAAEAQTRADKNSLDFVEQESGVKQARDVERIQAQSKGNIALVERKAQLDIDGTQRKALQDYVLNHNSK